MEQPFSSRTSCAILEHAQQWPRVQLIISKGELSSEKSVMSAFVFFAPRRQTGYKSIPQRGSPGVKISVCTFEDAFAQPGYDSTENEHPFYFFTGKG
jgi:hypothetical protein